MYPFLSAFDLDMMGATGSFCPYFLTMTVCSPKFKENIFLLSIAFCQDSFLAQPQK